MQNAWEEEESGKGGKGERKEGDRRRGGGERPEETASSPKLGPQALRQPPGQPERARFFQDSRYCC